MENLEEFARIAEQKLGERLESAKAHNMQIIQRISDHAPVDLLAPAKALQFHADTPLDPQVPGRIQIGLPERNRQYVHPWALQQLYSRVGLPKQYADSLVNPETNSKVSRRWAHELLAHNLPEL